MLGMAKAVMVSPSRCARDGHSCAGVFSFDLLYSTVYQSFSIFLGVLVRRRTCLMSFILTSCADKP